ncbi:MAG: ABC transporter ATP-binding protein [Candidatus Sedimenticola endophacoides]
MHGLTLAHFQSPGLAPIDLSLEPGRCLAASGPSGSGKTRLLRAIADLDPCPGEVRLDGSARDDLPATQWRRQVGYLPAESHWWRARVGDHFSPSPHDLLHALGLEPACLDWEVARLSSGERQRLALARLLANRPRVLLLDEPTANLDQLNIERVERLIGGIRETHATAVLWVSHDPAQRRRVASRGLEIRNGQLEPEIWS